jgi:outer membrane lipoprotein carrier protein
MTKIFMTIESRFLLVIVLFMFLPTLAFCGELPPLEYVIQKFQISYEKTQDLRADFIQETTIKSIKKTQREEGKVFFKNPKNMSWNYTKPSGKKLVINRQAAWLYLPQEKVVYAQKSDSIFQSKLLINFFAGTGKLKDDFIITYAESEALDKNGNYLLILTPREKTAACNLLKLTIDKDNFYILQVSFEDALGNSTTLKFSNIYLNTGLTENFFQFKPPAGVEIFEVP